MFLIYICTPTDKYLPHQSLLFQLNYKPLKSINFPASYLHAFILKLRKIAIFINKMNKQKDLIKAGEEVWQYASYQFRISNIQAIKESCQTPEIDFLQTAFNQTFVLKISFNKLQHYSKKGELLGQLKFQDPDRQPHVTFMPNEFEVFSICSSPLFQIKEQQIVGWNLKTHQTKKFDFPRQLSTNWFTCMHSESKIFCICQAESYFENYRFKISKVKLNYFKWPYESPFFSVIIDIPQERRGYQLRMVKLNNKTKIGILQTNLTKSDTVFVLVYDLQQEYVGWRTYQIKPEVYIPKVCSIKIIDLYEMRPSMFYLRIGIEIDKDKIEKATSEEISFLPLEKEVDFLWDFKNNTAKKISLTNDECHFVQFVGQYRSINPWVQKKVVYPNRSFIPLSEETYKQVTIVYIHPDSGETKATQRRKFPIFRPFQSSVSWVKITPVFHNPLLLVEYFQDEKEGQVLVTIKKLKSLPIDRKTIYVGMICSLIDQPDQQLLQQMTDLFEEEKQKWQWNINDL